jgi:predicted nucleic acid-binding protein
MYSIVVMDCDLISSFAKVNRIDLLETLFPDAQLVITASVYNELLKTKEYGVYFLDKIIQSNVGQINVGLMSLQT